MEKNSSWFSPLDCKSKSWLFRMAMERINAENTRTHHPPNAVIPISLRGIGVKESFHGGLRGAGSDASRSGILALSFAKTLAACEINNIAPAISPPSCYNS
jgi:hypothetical protein